jgi:hypothetical protein
MTKQDYSRDYHIPGCSKTLHRPKNAIFISEKNSIQHELSKCIGAIQIQRFGDLKWDNRLKWLVNKISEVIDSNGLIRNPSDFITEAVPNDEENRRVDLVNLSTGDRIEFEKDHSINKGKDCITIYL